EDEALLVLNKPAGLVCHPTKGDERSSLVGRLRLAYGADHKVHLLNRLDRETGGLVLLAKGDVAARELRRVLEGGQITKEYAAIVAGWPEADDGSMEGPVGLAEASEVAIRRGVRADGKRARTDYSVARRFERPEGRFALLDLMPRTGRTHQIRVHLAALGHPIVGDKIYGPDERLFIHFTRRELTGEQRASLLLPCQALHARRLSFEWRGRGWDFVAEPEVWFTGFVAGAPVDVDWAEAYV
ncbi:MAG: RluA family pseudouridine synthase, partial [Verrucomicrobiae bacterium]|nr:RluA family pseudouridine synthase [Verrucomicrobiae bacterium]